VNDMIKIIIDLLKAITVDAWDGFRERRFHRKIEKYTDKLVDKYGLLGAFVYQFESAIAGNISEENAKFILDDFVNSVLPILQGEYRVEMDDNWQTIADYCEHYDVIWDSRN